MLSAETQALRGKKWHTQKDVNIYKLNGICELIFSPIHLFIHPRNFILFQSEEAAILTLEILRDQELIYSKLIFMIAN